MPPKCPWPSRAEQTETLHIYRHLLREISYLPPSFSASISSHVRTRFHANRKPNSVSEYRVTNAKKALRNLRLANNGDAKRMLQVMHRGFGRAGLRRWQLFEKFRESEGPADSDALAALTGGASKETRASQPSDELTEKEKRRKERAERFQNQSSRLTPAEQEAKATKEERKADIKAKAAPDPNNANLNYRWLEDWDRKKLVEYVKSQKGQQSRTPTVVWEQGELRNPNERHYIPEETTWGKAPGKKLVRTKLAEYWKSQALKILPPLGKGEWELLEKLSLGAQPDGEWKMPKRRTPAKPLRKSHEENSWNWEDYASRKTRAIEPGHRVKQSKRLGRVITPFTGQTLRTSLSERWFQRQYQKIFLKSSYADKNPKTLRDQYVWGTYPTYNAKPKEHQMLFIQKPKAAVFTSEGVKEKISAPTIYLFKQRKLSPLYSRFS